MTTNYTYRKKTWFLRVTDAGKVAWYRACWEAKGGKKGDWTTGRAMIP
jgi:hypothetical protein